MQTPMIARTPRIDFQDILVNRTGALNASKSIPVPANVAISMIAKNIILNIRRKYINSMASASAVNCDTCGVSKNTKALGFIRFDPALSGWI